MLAGSFPPDVNKIIFGGRLIAEEKDGGERPIAIGYLIRRLAAKCANRHVIQRRSEILKPVQLGVDVPGGAEATVHATRCLLSQMPSDHAIVKLDFINAFNSVWREVVLDAAAQNTSELYRFVHAACSCEPILAFGEHQILSKEDIRQGKPLSALEFCEAVQPLLSRCESDVDIGFMNDFTLSGQLDTVATDVEMIKKSVRDIGLVLNPTKCEIICFDDKSANMKIFNDYIRLRPEDMTLLGALILKGPAIDKTLQ